MSGPSTARLFVAAEVPEAYKAACAAFRAGPGLRFPEARWTRPEGIHLTFRFLGETPEERIAAIREGLAAALRPAAPFRLVTGAAGFFGSPARPRVLWTALDGETAAAAELAARIETALLPMGFAPEERPFRPHLTLARIDPSGRARIPAGLMEEAERALSGISFEVREAILYQSFLEKGGARYVARARFALEGAGGGER